MKKIKLTGVVGWDLIPDDIAEKLQDAAGADLDVYIASPGGYVTDGLEIFNMFRDYKREHPKSQIVATIKGMAASMATYLAVNPAFDMICAEDNAVFMIHNAFGCACGDYKDMQTMSEVLEGMTSLIANAYVKKTEKSKNEIMEMMDKETWLFGDEIKEAGFVDEIIKTENKCGDGDKKSAMAVAKEQFKNAMTKIEDKKQDIQKIAAMINGKNIFEKIANTMDEIEIAQTPAENNAGKNNNGGSSMTLNEFLKENPTAQTELDTMLNERYEAGKQAMQDIIDKASPYLNSSEYPKEINGIAIDVINGKKSYEALETSIVLVDMFRESQNSQAAQTESQAQGDASGQQHEVSQAKDGIIDSEADFQAEVARNKASYGMEE